MTWEGSSRKARLPSNWHSLRTTVLKRDGHRCQHPVPLPPTGTHTDTQWTVCAQQANQVDHITPGDDHTLGNLQALCTFHHKKKSSFEGNNSKKNKNQSRFRDFEQNPFSKFKNRSR